MTVLQHYQALCDQGSITPDAEQRIALHQLQAIYDALLRTHTSRSTLSRLLHKPKPITGLYLWGGVGIGKTMLLDCFYQALPTEKKLRLHFYSFMQRIHHELRNLQGTENPLRTIAKNIAEQAWVLCFDEFIVTDIVDALILKNLLGELFSQGVCLVSTSNVAPQHLCKRAWLTNFSPAIAAIQQHMTILHVNSQTDYRKTALAPDQRTDDYSNRDKTEQSMEASFQAFTQGNAITTEAIEILSRPIAVKKRSAEVIWFSFAALCSIPRCQQDYLAISAQYNIIFISDIPTLTTLSDNVISLFIRLIDILYDAKTRVIFSSTTPIEKLYTQGKMSFEFARTRSRLLHMQAISHLSR